jgi:hypothetical protein
MSYSNEPVLPSKIFLYGESSSKNLSIVEISSYIGSRTGLKVEKRNDFLQLFGRERVEPLAKELASCKVRNLDGKEDREPLYGEISVEKRLLTNKDLKLPGILYDGVKLQKVLRPLIPEEEMNLDNAHLIFTNRLFATFDDDDKRFHARVVLAGYPSMISTSGIVEAPAKPKGFYAAKHKLGSLGVEAAEMIKEQYKDEIIDYEDERLTEVLKGYAMQALFYHMMGEPFCEIKQCRLFNAHWQSEVIEAQLDGDRYCERHEEALRKVKNARG